MMNSIAELQGRLSKSACPSCAKPKLDLRLRCDLGLHECLYLVKCGGCDTNYTISSESQSVAKGTDTAGHGIMSLLTCPKCGSATTELGFQCDVKTQGCFYTITCKACGTAIHDYQ
jgi:transcription elongation factor Elf1